MPLCIPILQDSNVASCFFAANRKYQIIRRLQIFSVTPSKSVFDESDICKDAYSDPEHTLHVSLKSIRSFNGHSKSPIPPTIPSNIQLARIVKAPLTWKGPDYGERVCDDQLTNSIRTAETTESRSRFSSRALLSTSLKAQERIISA